VGATLPVTYTLVRDADSLAPVLAACRASGRIGLDTETTGLDPRKDRVRLLQLAPCSMTDVFLLDLFAIDPKALPPLFEVLAGTCVIGHNLGFDLAFLAPLDFEPGAVGDTMLLSLLLHGPRQDGFHKLDRLAERELGLHLPKDQQRSDWSGELSSEQLEYAARDAAVLLLLNNKLQPQVNDAGMREVARIEMRALPALAWLSRSGVAFDKSAWAALADAAAARLPTLEERVNSLAPEKPAKPDGKGRRRKANPRWNWNSHVQIKEAFALLDLVLEDTQDDTLAAVDHELARALREFKGISKLTTTYGAEWVRKHLAADGRVYADWAQCGAVTGRMACSSPNLQNLPRDARYRACFVAPPGRVLIKSDYSQIELRIAAKVANEQRMLDAFRRGDDLHRLTARRMTGRADVTDEDRRLAKPVNFGMIYGRGADSLMKKARSEYGIGMSKEQAEQSRRVFFATYPGIARWHRQLKHQQRQQLAGREKAETRTLTGRRVVVKPDFWYGGRANYVVQGTGGDGIKLALALLWERRDRVPGAFPVLVVHDELVIECAADQAEAAQEWLRQAMFDAMAPLIDPVPVGEIEAQTGRTWGGD
jgi:DNA polymerase-1